MNLQTPPDFGPRDDRHAAVDAGAALAVPAYRPAVDEYRACKSRLYRWARGLDLTGTQRCVLKSIISSAKSGKPVRISQATIAHREGWSLPTVKRAISALRKKGAIRVELQYNRRGKRTSSLHHLNVDQAPVLSPTKDHLDVSTRDHQPISTKDHCDPTSTYHLSKTESLLSYLSASSGGEVGHNLRTHSWRLAEPDNEPNPYWLAKQGGTAADWRCPGEVRQ